MTHNGQSQSVILCSLSGNSTTCVSRRGLRTETGGVTLGLLALLQAGVIPLFLH